MVLVAGKCIAGAFHEVSSCDVELSYGVDDDVDMDIAGGAVPIGMGTDDCLVAREILLCKG